MLWRAILVCVFAVCAFAPLPAMAAPEEVQVYMDEMSDPGQFGLDIHNSYVVSGDRTPAYPGEQQSLGRYRITPEFSLGLTRNLELGAYLPLAAIDGHGELRAEGVKFRLKYIAPAKPGSHFFWGANFEVGRVTHRLDENPYNAELKGIAGYHGDKWTLALNANFDFKVSGPVSAAASFELATKATYAISPKLSLGIENYTGVGEIRQLGRFGSSEQSSYVTVDTRLGKWDLNFGIGTGYGSNPDHLILKAIVGIPID